MALFQKRYKNSKGETCAAKTWSIRFTDHHGRVRELATGLTRRADAELWQDRIMDAVGIRLRAETPGLGHPCYGMKPKVLAKLVKWKILEPTKAADKATLDAMLDAWDRSMGAENLSMAYRKTARRQVEIVLSPIKGWPNAPECKDEVRQAILDMDVCNATRKLYWYQCRKFASWAAETYEIENPLDKVKLKLSSDPAPLNRRHFTRQEYRDLQWSLAGDPPVEGMDWQSRSLAYRLAAELGLRANEIRQMLSTWWHWSDSTLTIPSHVSKNRRQTVMQVPRELTCLVAQLPMAPGGRVFPTFPARPDRMLRTDLERADIDRVTQDGKLTFHSFRHSFVTWMIEAGVPMSTVRECARHSSLQITDTYTHTTQAQQRQAMFEVHGYVFND